MNRNCIFVAITYFTLAFVSESKAFFNPEKLFVRNFNINNGLPQCVVSDMALDQHGFLWIGTYDGLNRFDGGALSTFKHIPNDKYSLPSSKIYKIFADQHNHLWMNTASGFSLFDTRTGKIVQPAYLKDVALARVCKNDDKSVWLYMASKGLMLINTLDLSGQLIDAEQRLFPAPCNVLDIYKIGSNVFIVSTCGDILQYEIAKKKYTIYKHGKDLDVVYNNSGLDKYNDIYLGSNNDMICFKTEELRFSETVFYKQHIKLIDVKSIQFDAINNMLLLGTNGQGLFVYDYASATLNQYKKNGDELNLSSNYVRRTVTDKNGVVYVGYDGTGFDVLDPFIKKFRSIQKNGPEDFRSLNFVRKIIEDDQGNLLLGTSGSGLVKYNRAQHTFSFYNNSDALRISNNFVIEMIRVQNELWLGYNGHGVEILDINTLKKSGQFTPGRTENSISDGTIWSFLNDENGNVWVGTQENGLNKINIKTRKVKQFTRKDYPLLSSGMRCMYRLKNGTIMVGTEDGLLEIDGITNHIKKVFPYDEKTNPFRSFKSIHVDQKGRFWLSMDGMGILVLSKDFRMLNNFNSTNSLNNDVVYGILPENDSTFWLSSNAGLSSFTWNETSLQENGKIQAFNYDEKNGLQSNEFNTGAYTLLKDGSMAFGGVQGINVFHPKDIKNNHIVPIVYINAFKVFENILKQDTMISYLSSVNLKHFENSFSITFSTIGFSLPGKTKYMYRLIGNGDQWINADSRNYVSYTNLDPGEYEFQVKACNYDGIWNNKYTTLKVIIATPFYKSWWFILLVLAVMIQLAYLFYQYRKGIAIEKEELNIIHTKEIAEVEMKALRAQINPHFLFNSLNSINSYILKNDNKLASKYLIKFSQLVRNILNNSSNPYITLKEELNTIELYMHIEGMRFNNQFSYLIDVESNINTANILIPSLLLQPYVENAIWHGLLHKDGEKSIIIKVRKQSMESVCILIEDNGVGRMMAAEIEQKPKHRKSFGMALGENRLKLMNSDRNNISSVSVIDKTDEHLQPSGTIIKIIIPSNIFIEEKISLN